MVPTLRVLQLNVGSLFEPDWPARRVEIAAWLRQLQPDICCFQEVWSDSTTAPSVEWLMSETAEMGWHGVFEGAAFGGALWPDPSLRFGSAVLSRWPIESHAYHRLGVVDDPDPMPASVPWELLHARTAGLDVFSTHLAPAPIHGRHRIAQVLEIERIISETRGDRDALTVGTERAQMPAILCGDFNAEPDSDEIRFLCGLTPLAGRTCFYQDAWRVAGEGPGHTQDWRDNPIAAGLNVYRKRIDYVFVGDPFQRRGGGGRVLSAELACHRPLTGTVASDHRGLVVDIVWPQRPGR